jgi:hypothetical protein
MLGRDIAQRERERERKGGGGEGGALSLGIQREPVVNGLAAGCKAAEVVAALGVRLVEVIARVPARRHGVKNGGWGRVRDMR